MSIKLESGSRVIPDTIKPEKALRLEVVKTARSSKLARMMTYFRDPERMSYSHEDLMHLGITVISLPQADMVLNNEGRFRPHCPFGPSFIKEFSKYTNVSYMRSNSRMVFENHLKAMDLTGFGCIFPWEQV